VFPPLVRWYALVGRLYPAARPVVGWLFRLHEIENVKLLWRAALRGRPPIAACWRPLEPLGVVPFEGHPLTPDALVRLLDRTAYAGIARTLVRHHRADLPATEIGLDRWVWSGLNEEIARLPVAEARAAALLGLRVLEHDLDLLRRGAISGIDPDLVAKATVRLSSAYRPAALVAIALWRPEAGPLSRVLPGPIARLCGEPADWEAALYAVRRARLRACRRASVGWPFDLAPPIAALLLRDAQAQAAMSVAAARVAGADAAAALPLAFAASTLEA
jgi:hypothetical protein